MKGRELMDRLCRELEVRTDSELADALSITAGRVSQLRAKASLSTREVANMIARHCNSGMRGEHLVERLRDHLSASTDDQLARFVGVTQARISQLRRAKALTPREVVTLISRTRETARSGAISVVVERFPIEKKPSRQAAGYELFVADDHPYKLGLRDELKQHHGIYLFYDSAGRALYVGKATRQKLWPEMKSAFNRTRTRQEVLRVSHPVRRRVFKTNEEKVRQIVRTGVKLHELAAFFSAYQVEKALISDLEAVLVRSFANDLLNVKMEKFATQHSRHR